MSLLARLAATLPARPHVLELGAAQTSGGVFRALAPTIRRAQVWTLVDESEEALAEAREAIAGWAEDHGWVVTFPGRAMLVHAPGGAWRVEHRVSATDAPPPAALLAQADAVVCQNVLTAMTHAELARLVAALRQPFLATHLPDGHDVILPRHPHDRVVLQAAWRGLRERAPGGRTLGIEAPQAAQRLLAARGFSTQLSPRQDGFGRSPGFTGRMTELLADRARHGMPARRDVIADWEADRMRHIARGRLAMRPGRRDILAMPARTERSSR